MYQANWTTEEKPKVLNNLKEAGINPKSEVGRKILKFERSINTMWNDMGRGVNVFAEGYLNSSTARYNADYIMHQLGKYGEYHEEWKRYCAVKGVLADATVGDWIS